MRHAARLTVVLFLLLGMAVGVRQLAAVQAPGREILLLGLYTVGGAALFLLFLVGAGRGLAALAKGPDRSDDPADPPV